MNRESLLGYVILVGLPLCGVLALVNGYFLVATSHPVDTDPISSYLPSGPQIQISPEFVGSVPEKKGDVVVSEEDLLTSRLLWITVAGTGVAVLGRIFLHMQSSTTSRHHR